MSLSARGDVIVADGDGVVRVPRERAVEAADLAGQILRREQRVLLQLERGKTTCEAPLIQIASIGTRISKAFAELDRIREIMGYRAEDDEDRDTADAAAGGAS